MNKSSYESSISKRLLKEQFNSESPVHFEEALTEAFTHLGFEAEHIGGPNEPDVFITIDNTSSIIEAKTSKAGIINESFINFDAIDRYVSDKEVEHKAVVAVKFRTGNVIETARKHGVTLIETEALCEILEHHLISPLSVNELISLLFEMDVPVLTSDTVLSYISPESDLISGAIWILNYMMKLSETSELSIPLSKLKTLHEFHGGTFNWQAITDSLEFLANPPIAVISETNSNYSLNGDLEEIIEKVDIMQKAF
ncbi:MAG: restriction endonuclease, partial [Candidatus Hermodarchaeota archaeon]